MTSWSELAKQCHDMAAPLLAGQSTPLRAGAAQPLRSELGMPVYQACRAWPSRHYVAKHTRIGTLDRWYCLAGHHPMCLLQCADRSAAAAPSLLLPQRAGLEARYGSARSQGTCMHVCFALLARVLASVIQQGWGQGNMMRPGGHSGNHQQHAIVATAHRQLQPMSPLQLAVLQALQHSPLSVPLTAAPCCYSPRCCVGGCSCASTLTSSGSSVKRRSPWRLSGQQRNDGCSGGVF